MKQSVLLSVGGAAFAAAHGIVSDIKIGNNFFGGYNPFQDPYMNPAPQRTVWAFPSAGNGPVEDVSSPDIVCNKGATAAPISAPANAGDQVTFFWTEWAESHRGPAMTYLANCNGDCSKADPTTLDFFKIHHAGFENGQWFSDKLIANNNSMTVTIPSDIAPGNYILRHELLALHAAFNENAGQFYPACMNLEIKGSGSAKPAGVKFPGAYKSTDPGILVNIYQGLTSYTIPGPAVYGSASGSSGNAPAPASSSAPAATAASSVAQAPTTSAAAQAPATTVAAASSTVATQVPTTLATVTKPSGACRPKSTTAGSGSATTAPASAQPTTGTKKTPQEVNACLDKVNECIREKHKGQVRGGSVDFSSCEAQRAACY